MTRRGEIHWLHLAGGSGSEQTGRRPVLVVQNDVGNRVSPTTIVAAITSRARSRQYPFHVHFSAQESGLTRDGIVMCEQLHTINQQRLNGVAGSLGPERMQEVDVALGYSLGIRR